MVTSLSLPRLSNISGGIVDAIGLAVNVRALLGNPSTLKTAPPALHLLGDLLSRLTRLVVQLPSVLGEELVHLLQGLLRSLW